MNQFFGSTGDLEQQINSLSIRVVFVSAIALIVLITIAALTKGKKYKALKLPLFVLMSFIIVASTATLFGSTVYLNTKADSGGPVHWHADIEFWACGVQLELRNPSGFLSNKIGTSTLHEHNDQRIHLEGVVVEEEIDASLGKFMRVIGGRVSGDEASIPVADGVIEDDTDGDVVDPSGASRVEQLITSDAFGKKTLEIKDGQSCDNGQSSDVQVYVYQYDEDAKTYSQKKLASPDAYVIRGESVVPPADCIIIEFGPLKDRTDKLCRQYGIRDSDRCVEFGTDKFDAELCNIKQVSASGGNQ